MFELPKTYKEWKYCITIKCGIELTEDYIRERLDTLSNLNDYGTGKFVKMWGVAQHHKTVNWFQQAAQEIESERSKSTPTPSLK